MQNGQANLSPLYDFSHSDTKLRTFGVWTNYDGCLQKYNRLFRLSQILNKPSKPRLNGILRVEKGEFGVFSTLPNG